MCRWRFFLPREIPLLPGVKEAAIIEPVEAAISPFGNRQVVIDNPEPMATAGVDVQFGRNTGLLQCRVKGDATHGAHLVVVGVGHEGGRGVLGDGEFAFHTQVARDPAGVPADEEVRPRTLPVNRVRRIVDAMIEAGSGEFDEGTPGRESRDPMRAGSTCHSAAR